MERTKDMKYYREVKTSERLPDKGEVMTNDGWINYDTTPPSKRGIYPHSTHWAEAKDILWWLEPVEITGVTEEVKDMCDVILSKLKG